MDGTDPRISWVYIKFKPGVKVERGCAKVSSLWEEFVRARDGERLAGASEGAKLEESST
jgi:hypothetical protein